MEKISVEFENCFGISKLEHEFDFTEYSSHIVYAPNGVMKSSFARVFDKYQTNSKTEIEDRIFHKEPKHKITADQKEINQESIFVIKPFDESFHSENISEILLNQDLKKKYEEIVATLGGKKRDFLASISQHFQYIQKDGDDLNVTDRGIINHISNQTDIEVLFVSLFSDNEYNSEFDFYKTVLSLDESLKGKELYDFSQIKYGVIFNKNTEGKSGVLADLRNRLLLSNYVDRYKKLIKDSKYFNLNFTHIAAEKVLKQMKEADYFDALDEEGNSVDQNGFNLYNKKTQVKDQKERAELAEEVKELKKELTRDEKLSEIYKVVDKELDKNKVTRKLKQCLLEEEFDLSFLTLLSQYEDLSLAKRELILSYLGEKRELFDNFVLETQSAYKEIDALIQKVRDDESSIWHQSVAEFNSRFRVPFIVDISDDDKDKLLMNDLKVESLEYWFCEICGADANKNCTHAREGMRQINEAKLSGQNEDSILSQGERRAFYLLNIIFEIKYRQANQIETLFIIDDVADSFDYQNKYAIAEYLHEIKETSFFNSIILTHNFDFFRTLKNRLEINSSEQEGEWYWFAQRNDGVVSLQPQNKNKVTNPFGEWLEKLKKCKLEDSRFVYAVLLMTRNVQDYSPALLKKKSKVQLQNLVHGRGDDFTEITFKAVEELLSEAKLEDVTFSTDLKTRKFYETLEADVRNIVTKDLFDLEDKIVVSLYIRISTEIFLRDKLGKKKSSGRRLREMIQQAGEEGLENIEDLRRVNLITPEHIHINSFMYEPLIDLDKNQIVNLYKNIVAIVK